MHERQAALTGVILAFMFTAAAPALGENDAAVKAREGEIDHWIEYYRKRPEPKLDEQPREERPSAGTSSPKSEKDKIQNPEPGTR